MSCQNRRYIKRVTVDITNRCNLRCIMCPQYLDNGAKYDLPLEVYQKLASAIFPFTQELFLSCSYESMMSGVFDEIIEYTGQFQVPKTALVTNATLLNRERASRIVGSGLEYLMISVDGAKKETYEAIRKGARFDTLLENIRLLKTVKEEQGRRNPEIDLTFTLMKSNLDEIPLLVELAHSLDVGIVNIKPLQVHLKEMEKEALDASVSSRIRENLEAARARARACGISLHTSPEMRAFSGESPSPAGGDTPCDRGAPKCVEPFPSLYIRPSGDVFPCTLWKEKPVGNLCRQGFEEIWNDADYACLRRELTAGEYRESCRRCCYLVA